MVDAPPRTELADELRAVGTAAGLDLVRMTSAEPFESTRRDLEDRRGRGLHAGMAFTYRNPRRSTTPEVSLPGARSLVVGARSYNGAAAAAPEGGGLTGRVCRSAVRDEYALLREGLDTVAARLRVAGYRTRVVADDNALVDRAAAHRAGIGWWGKNTLVIVPGVGSWFVLGSVITDAVLPPDQGPVADKCGSCSRCMPACPTGALIAPGVLDARRCLAWLLEAPGPIPFELREAVGDRIYGCDECQVVCPPNRAAELRRARLGAGSKGVGVELRTGRPDLASIVLAADSELMTRLGHFYLAGRDPDLLRRNALVALGNVARGDEPRVVEALTAGLTSDNPLVRAHAVWAAARLSRHELLARVAEVEHDPTVLNELADALARRVRE